MSVYKDIVKKISIPANDKTKQKEYLESGILPIIDQSQRLIGGYSDELSKTIHCDLPVIVFGDHTKCVKYVDFPFGAGADGIKILQPRKDVLPKYLYYGTKYLVLRMPDKGYARHYQHIEKMELAVPTIIEQERIVDKIEEMFSELDNSVKTLQIIKQQLAVYREAVLKEAFDEVQANAVFIKDICKEIKVGIVIKPTRYYVDSEGVPAFRNANVRRGYIEDKDWVIISEEGHDENRRSIVHTNDVLIARSGANLGMAAVATKKYDGYNAIDIVIAVPKPECILSEYLAVFTNSAYGRTLIKENQSGSAQGHINVTTYGKLRIPLPSKNEQKQLLNKVESYLSFNNDIEQMVDITIQQAQALGQSILREAFNVG